MVSDATHPVFLKTQMCKFHAAGKCMRGVNCKFAHSQKELAPAPDFSRTKMCPELCSTGRCSRGADCKFAHSAMELRSRGRGGAREAAGASAPVEGVPPPPQRPQPSAAPPSRAAAAAAAAAAAPPSRAPLAQAPSPPSRSVEAQPVLLVAQALPVQVQAIQMVSLQCLQVPVAASYSRLGGCAAGFAGVPQVTRQEPLPQEFLRAKMQEVVAEASCCGKDEDDDLDLPENSWSRQSTEEDAFEASADFSRQSTQEAWVPVEADDLADEDDDDFVPTVSGGVLNMDACISAEAAAAVEQKMPVCPLAAPRLGYVVKKTFIELDEEEESLGQPIRRTRSTGDCWTSAF